MVRRLGLVIASVVLTAGLAAPVVAGLATPASAGESPAAPAAGGTVSCANPTFCVDLNVGRYTGQIELWNGSSFSVMPQSSSGGGLLAVACVSTAMCIGVGQQGFPPSGISERWDGSQWASIPTPNVGYLDAVTCLSASDCIAVGQNGVLTWNGSAWSTNIVPSLGAMSGLACDNAITCVAVGGTSVGGPLAAEEVVGPLVVPEPVVSTGSGEGGLSDVACPSLLECFAVGSQGNRTVMEQSTARIWLPATNALPGTGALSGIACPTSTFCMAVGDPFGPLPALAESWNGSGWSALATPIPPAGDGYELSSVSCTTGYCIADGSHIIGNDITQNPLVEVWNGATWSVVVS